VKRTLMILGGVFLGIFVAAVVGISILVVKGNALDKESKEYANTAIVAAISNWDVHELKRRASPEFSSATSDEELGRLFSLFSMLGRLRVYQGCRGQATISVTMQEGKVVRARYVGRAEFEKGPAEIQITLIKHGEAWQVLGFRVDSKVFLRPA